MSLQEAFQRTSEAGWVATVGRAALNLGLVMAVATLGFYAGQNDSRLSHVETKQKQIALEVGDLQTTRNKSDVQMAARLQRIEDQLDYLIDHGHENKQ